ncbi:MAG: hypothetical protein P9M06_06305 [Candidatus Saelkia tenebricola]|nr:hypothetical protein [Candidatus Saelkia tenebricola]
MKILIIGAGNVGAHIAYLSLFSSLDEVAVYDIQKELVLGKTLDLSHSAGVLKKDLKFRAVQNLAEEVADIVVITAGMPRKEGMSRADLLDVNVKIMQDIIENLNEDLLQNAVFIIVANPVDVLSYYFYKKTGIAKNRLIGMAGALDAGRFRYHLHENIDKKISDLNPVVIGSHSKDMMCVYKEGDASLIDKAKVETQNAGAKVVSYYKGGSAYFAPASGVKTLIDAVIEDKNEIIPSVAVLEGEYGYSDIAFGVPVRISKTGISEIIKLQLSKNEEEELKSSVNGIEDSIAYLREKNLI